MKDIDDEALRITKLVYEQYANGYGVLFGIPSNLKDAVRVVIKSVLRVQGYEKELEKPNLKEK
ncbi:hypothetical protein KKG81_07390 [bacterium]|nr:hypothetical protein [bacterium]